MLNVFLTFDYELFFNDTDYSDYNVLIEPSQRLFDIMEKHNVNGTFFVDMSSISRYLELGMVEFPEYVRKQMCRFYEAGHDVQLHTHPHWYKSFFVDGKWIFDNEHYCLSSFSEDEIEKILSSEKTMLEEMLQKKHPGYRCDTFRAGGFCIQPINLIGKKLSNIGIKIDSSVCSGAFLKNGIHNYNFKDVPRFKNYTLDVMLNNSSELIPIQELPIGTIENKLLKFHIWKIMPKLNIGILRGNPTPTNESSSFIGKYISKLKNAWYQPVLLCFDGLHYTSMIKALEYIKAKSDLLGNDINIALLCHPKFMTDSTLNNFDVFFSEIDRKNMNLKFRTVHEMRRDNNGNCD